MRKHDSRQWHKSELAVIVLLTTCTCSKRMKKKVSFTKEGPWRSIKITSFIKAHPFRRALLIFCVIKLEIHTNHLCIPRYNNCFEKSIHMIVWVVSWISCLFHEMPILLKETTDRQTMLNQTRGFRRHFLKYKRCEPITSRRTTDNICSDQFKLLIETQNFGKTVSTSWAGQLPNQQKCLWYEWWY